MQKREHLEKIIGLVRSAIDYDKELRQQYKIDDKFRFVKEQLAQLLEELESQFKSTEVIIEKPKETAADEITIYIYLFNVHGMNVRSWINMLSQKQFNEYVFNRPIYTDKKSIETLIRSKANKVQHAYLTLALKNEHLIKSDNAPLDSLGNSLAKVKEGSLRFENFISLTHNDITYRLNEEGELYQV